MNENRALNHNSRVVTNYLHDSFEQKSLNNNGPIKTKRLYTSPYSVTEETRLHKAMTNLRKFSK